MLTVTSRSIKKNQFKEIISGVQTLENPLFKQELVLNASLMWQFLHCM